MIWSHLVCAAFVMVSDLLEVADDCFQYPSSADASPEAILTSLGVNTEMANARQHGEIAGAWA
jgi:hypothetical protein